MKKIIVLLLTALLLFSLCSCIEKPGEDTGADAGTDTVTKDYDKLAFASGGKTFGIGDRLDDVTAVIGEPLSTFEAESCAYQGKDCFYYYDGFELMANEFDGALVITGITVDDDTVAIPQGVRIGMDIEEALALMDVEGSVNGSIHKFTEGSTILRIREGDDGTVAAIEYVTAAGDAA